MFVVYPSHVCFYVHKIRVSCPLATIRVSESGSQSSFSTTPSLNLAPYWIPRVEKETKIGPQPWVVKLQKLWLLFLSFNYWLCEHMLLTSGYDKIPHSKDISMDNAHEVWTKKCPCKKNSLHIKYANKLPLPSPI